MNHKIGKFVAFLVCAVAMISRAEAQTVSANTNHTLLVKPDGSAWAWGLNNNGELGDNSTTRREVPNAISGLTSGVTAVAAGLNHSLALKSDGTVWTWGYNGNGQLGLNDTTRRLVPVQVSTLSNVIAIAAGANHSLAVKSDGSVWGWGANNFGQVGDNSTTQRNAPVQLTTLSGITAIASRANHSLALKSDGTVRAWGNNGNGQLGDNSTTPRSAPVTVTGLTSVIAISAGTSHSLALKTDNSAWAWGFNSSGQLGDSSQTQRLTAVAVANLGAVDRLVAGGDHSMALKADGSVWTWGRNTNGQLGDGTTTMAWSAVSVATLSDVAMIAAGDQHSLAVTSDGTVWAGGYNTSSQIGDGTRVTRKTPVKVSEASYVWKVGTPTFSIPAGTYTTTQNVVIASVTAGATIRYTTNGTTPTETDAQVPANGIVTVSESLTLKAKAWKAGIPESNVDEAAYVLRVATPTVSPGTNTYTQPQSVTVSSSSPGVTLRYTTNGTDPTTSDPVVASGSTVSVAESLTLKVRGWRDNWTMSDIATATYTMKVAQPTLSPGGGSYTSAQAVTISTVTPSATLHYTTNGAEPTTSDPSLASGSSVTLNSASTLKVTGFRNGWTDSDTRIATYTFALGTVAAPVFSPSGGTYTSGQAVTLTSATADAVIRYTTDGSEPTLLSKRYTAPLSIDKPATIKARGFKRDWTASATSISSYTFDYGTVAIPEVSPAPGEYATARTITVVSATAGAAIHYTTNGAEPSTADPSIASGGTIVVGQSARLRLKAVKAGMDPSAVLTADYWITGTVAAGDGHTVALKADGTVWSWGANGQGQLGDNSQTPSGVPVPAVGLSDVVGVSAGHSHTLAVKRDGTVWAWGSNSSAQLGEATSTLRRIVPTQVAGLTDVIAVAAGESHSVALKRDGTVCAWGSDFYGQVGDGDGSTSPRTSPWCGSVTGAAAIAAGGHHTLALKTDGEPAGTVWVWGANGSGQVGDGSTTSRTTPVGVLSGATALGGGQEHSLAVLADGTVRAWGKNMEGMLGDGTQVQRTRPVVTADVAGATHVSGGRDFSLLRTSDFAVWLTGRSYSMVETYLSVLSATRIAGAGITVIAADAGSYHNVVARRDGSVWAWGGNGNYQLGDGTTTSSGLPKKVPNFSLVYGAWLTGDPDADGLETWRELELGTDPLNPDTNGDGLRDGAAVNAGMSATNPDMDGDGVPNTVERQNGTDPFRADSDGDTVADGSDAFPLDPTRSQAPAPVPGDTTPPVITLLFPTNWWRLP